MEIYRGDMLMEIINIIFCDVCCGVWEWISPDTSGPVFHSVVDQWPEWHVTHTNLGTTDNHHEDEWCQNVDPEIDHDHNWEHVDGGVAGVGVQVGIHHPDCSCHQPAYFKQNVN